MNKFLEKINKICRENKKVAMFIDMDGTICDFGDNDGNCLREEFPKDYFLNKKPIKLAIDNIRKEFKDDFLYISVRSRLVTHMGISIVVAIVKLRRIVASIDLGEIVASVGSGRIDLNIDSVRPFPYMTKRILDTSITRHITGVFRASVRCQCRVRDNACTITQ